MKLVLKLGFIIFFFTDLYTIGDKYIDFFFLLKKIYYNLVGMDHNLPIYANC